MFLQPPDIATLRLSSLLASMSYAAIFFVLWSRRRSETYLLHWCASSALYATALIGFELVPVSGASLPAALTYGAVATSDFLLLTGMRRFDGKHPFQAWMAIPILATMVAAVLPLILLDANADAIRASHILGSAALGTCMVICAWTLLAGSSGDAALPRRIVGFALLAYGPGYIVSICVELWGPFQSETLDLLPMLQDQVLLGVLNLGLLATPWQRAVRALIDSARRDPLTGAWNRVGLKWHEPALARPGNSIFLIDIDHFKVINDTFGHAAGDAVLVAFATRIASLARVRNGVFARLGGDEFVLVAPTADDAEARALAEEIRAAASAEIAGLPPYSLCVGMARVQEGETSVSQAMARADRSLYRAKAGGRDQVAACTAAAQAAGQFMAGLDRGFRQEAPQ